MRIRNMALVLLMLTVMSSVAMAGGARSEALIAQAKKEVKSSFSFSMQ